MVAQLTVNQEVVGSSPTVPANKEVSNKSYFVFLGSNPSFRSMREWRNGLRI